MPGTSATTWTTNPSVHYHPHSQAGTVTKTGNIVTACPDLRGLAALLSNSTNGPIELTDAAGIKFWRFNGTQYAAISNTLSGIANRGYSAAMVVRVHHRRSFCSLLSPRFAAYTSDVVNTAANASIRFLNGVSTSSSAMVLQGSAPAPFTNATDAYKTVLGTQLQVAAVASRTTANGGQRIYINNDICDVAQTTNTVTGYVGAIIGGAAGASNTANINPSTNNTFDLYELAFWNSSQTNANMDANIAAMVANWSIAQIDGQLLLEGDSITDGIATTLATNPVGAGSVGSWLTNPGALMVPANVRVINNGQSGNQASDIVTRRDAVNANSTLLMPGGAAKNRIIIQIGRNDVSPSAGNRNSTQVYGDLVALANTATTGYLQRGWQCYFVANIASSSVATSTNNSPPDENTLQKRIEGLRALVAIEASKTPQPQFLTDTLSNTGQTYEGSVKVIHAYDISQGGNRWFYDAVSSSDYANAIPPGPYDNDLTHLVAEGYAIMASGGDTPQYGYASVYTSPGVLVGSFAAATDFSASLFGAPPLVGGFAASTGFSGVLSGAGRITGGFAELTTFTGTISGLVDLEGNQIWTIILPRPPTITTIEE